MRSFDTNPDAFRVLDLIKEAVLGKCPVTAGEERLMSKRTTQPYMLGLDVGTTKIVALMGALMPEGELQVVGHGVQPSQGLKRGVVVNIEATTHAIRRALEDAERMAGAAVTTAYTGLAGAHIKSLNSHGIVAIRHQEVTQADVDRVIEAAKAVAIPADQKILHIIPQEFIVDQQEGIKEPVGMSGVRLEARVHIITAAVSAAQNIMKCVQQCGLQVSDVILGQLAATQAILSDDEKELGVCLVDIGGGTTDVAVYTQGALRHTAVIPIAGDQVTQDVAVALRTPSQHAEKLKVEQGHALASQTDGEAIIQVSAVTQQTPRSVRVRVLADVIEARYEEILTLVASELQRQGLAGRLAAGIVLTGGGAKMTGLAALAEQVLQCPVRIGQPNHLAGMADELRADPAFATSIGLLQHAYQQQAWSGAWKTGRRFASVQGVWSRMRQWFQSEF